MTDMTPFIPFSLAEVTADYLTNAFREVGLLQQGEIVSFESRVIGEGAGFLGEVAKVQLTLSDESTDAPQSLILKIPTALKNRDIGQTLGVYEREIRFYQELGHTLNIRTPRHYFSSMEVMTDPAKALKDLRLMHKMPLWLIRMLLPLMNWINSKKVARYVLMIENLDGLRVGDQVAGCSMDDARRALSVMAQLHGQFWDDAAALAHYPWLIPLELAAKPSQMMFLQTIEPFKAANTWLTPDQLALLEWLREHYFEMVDVLLKRPATLLHGDFRLDNLCFDDATNDVVLFDWQTLGIGAGATDLGYFLSAAIGEDADETETTALIEHYHAELGRAGVNTSLAAVQWDYQIGLLGVLQRTVPALFQDMLLLEGRGNDLVETWIYRTLHQLRHVDPDRLLAEAPSVWR